MRTEKSPRRKAFREFRMLRRSNCFLDACTVTAPLPALWIYTDKVAPAANGGSRRETPNAAFSILFHRAVKIPGRRLRLGLNAGFMMRLRFIGLQPTTTRHRRLPLPDRHELRCAT